MKILRFRKKDGGSGNVWFPVQMPEGARILMVQAINNTKLWQSITLQVGQNESGDEPLVRLVSREIQAGLRYVNWQGKPFLVESGFTWLLGYFYGCDAADDLRIAIGYEMPPKRAKWGLGYVESV